MAKSGWLAAKSEKHLPFFGSSNVFFGKQHLHFLPSHSKMS
jgi:hypothetical protein